MRSATSTSNSIDAAQEYMHARAIKSINSIVLSLLYHSQGQLRAFIQKQKGKNEFRSDVGLLFY